MHKCNAQLRSDGQLEGPGCSVKNLNYTPWVTTTTNEFSAGKYQGQIWALRRINGKEKFWR